MKKPPSFYLKSMTACGRAELMCDQGRFVCELQSLNRRYLDLHLHLPKKLASCEIEIRRYLGQSLGRGCVTCTMSWQALRADQIGLEPNVEWIRSLQGAWSQLATLTQHTQQMPIEFLLAYQEHIFSSQQTHQTEQLQTSVMQVCHEACCMLQKMKQQEGMTLAEELASYLQKLTESLQQIIQRAPESTVAYRSKLLERLQPLLVAPLEYDERILKELALFAERVDISEECVRIKSHLEYFMQWLQQPFVEEKQSKGKTAEFIVQELQREVNTIGSKASDFAMSKEVIVMKSILEKMREQIQNIE